MPLFAYRGRTNRGELVTGELEAESTDAVAAQLFNTGITPIDIVARGTAAGGLNIDLGNLLGHPPPTLDDLTFFARQMHSLTKSGVPLIRGLRALAETTRNVALRAVIADVTNSLESGRDLAGSLARHPDVFDALFVNLVRVGEDSGTLEESFARLAQYMQREKDTRQRIKSAVRYPMIVMVTIAIAIAVVTIWVIPTFAQVFAKANLTLPLPTKLILGFSAFMVAWWPAILAGIVAAIFGFRQWVATERGRYQWDRRKLRFPVIGSILFMATMARFSRTLAITFRSGVPIVQAMSLVARGVANEFLAERIQGMRMGVERGESLTRTATATGLFPPLVVQMVQVGEETGRLDHMLDECADYFDGEVDYEIKNLSASIEPILTVAIGIVVLILALGVFLPMWDLTQLARK